jgi:phosphate transport system permease protein
LLAAVPSIVYGMWGLLVFGPILATYVQQPLQALFTNVPYLGALVSGPPVGIGILSAGIILAIMIIPFIAAVMRDVFDVTPPMLREFNQLDSLSLFQAANSITSALANEFAEAASGLHQAALMYLGLVLFFITFVVLALSKILLARLRKNEGAKS